MSTQTMAGVRWLAWGPEVFQRARAEDKLILLDSGATWCHWCHVMDHHTYEDDEVVRIINEKFIPVRIDRDRLPELDARLQRDEPIIDSQAGGWPLTVILTPQGQTLFKATFVPPRAEAGLGGVGMVELLGRLDDFWRANRAQLERAARDLRRRQAEAPPAAGASGAKIDGKLIESLLTGLRAQFDEQHGGFGEAPKFYSAPALEFLLALAWGGHERALEMACRTLEAIARGGVHDQLAGGFHRYSVDARWHVPHFEKLASDNAALLGLFANAFALTGREEFADVARVTIRWIDRVLLDVARRGFYSSRDADAAPGDDGDFFTWTIDEIRQALGDQADVAIYYYAVSEDGDMPHRPGRNVLHVPKTLQQVSRLLGRPVDELRRVLDREREALLSVREKRPAPAVDRTIFADINGMMIDAYLSAAERLGDAGTTVVSPVAGGTGDGMTGVSAVEGGVASAGATALEVLDNLLEGLRDERGVFAHYRDEAGLHGIGLLADQAWMMRALVHAFAFAGDAQYLSAAQTLADYIRDQLTDPDGVPLSSPESPTRSPADVSPIRSWEDGPVRNAGTVACEAFLQMHHLTGRDEYRAWAGKALESAGRYVRHEWAPLLGGIGLSVEALLHGPRVLVVAGPIGDKTADALLKAARATYVPAGLALLADPSDERHRNLLQLLSIEPAAQPVAYVCHGRACLAPATSVADLRKRIQHLASPE